MTRLNYAIAPDLDSPTTEDGGSSRIRITTDGSFSPSEAMTFALAIIDTARRTGLGFSDPALEGDSS
jgi:hypothetical protein